MSVVGAGDEMITQLEISNYRSLGRDLRLVLGPMSVLVGPNGSGKSNTLDALTFVSDALTQGLPAAVTHRGGIDNVRRRSHGHPYNVAVGFELRLGEATASYRFELTGDRPQEYRVKSEHATIRSASGLVGFTRTGDSWSGPEGLSPRVDAQNLALGLVGGDVRFKPLLEFLSSMTVYSVFPDTLRRPQRFDPTQPMKRHGDNWVSVLRELIETDGKAELLAGLAKLTGDIEDVRVTSAAGYLVAQFKQQRSDPGAKSKRWFDSELQSDGTLRVAGILTALLQRPAVPLVGLEEPELTVHPGALPLVFDYLREASELSQVIITTHSPIVLDLLDVETEAAFVVDRHEGVTAIEKVPPRYLAPVRNKLMSLGEMFLSGDMQLNLFDHAQG